VTPTAQVDGLLDLELPGRLRRVGRHPVDHLGPALHANVYVAQPQRVGLDTGSPPGQVTTLDPDPHRHCKTGPK